ncbi:alpha/beta hydrolase [Brevibacillus ruminantium]|uniref:Alpha/beta hydrolase n=1 Tax=Brevibacillus ruminantium TaxID=2950604 RepID=A0ABY4WB64_9BACL|nr:alpha/beta hydrolase [Brevibacillus ruminantium]USG64408.1 alpha/beta hydrolase [Brevibacillus ruminantium]
MWIAVVLTFVVILGGLIWFNQYKFKQADLKFPPSGQFVTVEGIQLHYIRKGSGKPVVFLHGGVLTGNDFINVLNIAATKGYQAIAFDRPGYGHSERPKSHKVTPMVQARLINAALKKLGIEKPIIVGHSWSGLLVLSYALLYPKEIDGIVTIAAAMYKEGYPAENGDPISKLVTTPVIGKLFLHTVLRSPLGTFLADRILQATFAPEEIPNGYREATHALWLRPGQFRANREDILAFSPAAKNISARYKEIQNPIVIVVGDKDPFGVKEQAIRLKEDIPHAELIILPEVAHMIPQNHPKHVVEIINRLVKSKNSNVIKV